MEKIFIGTVREDYKNGERSSYVAGERIYITKHSWDCGWYWGFGYVGNQRLHTHFDGAFLGAETNVNKIFVKPVLTQEEWWLVRDLFIQAYALKKAAEVYRYGGHQTSEPGITDMIRDDEMCKRLNEDLRKVLDKVWEIFEAADERRTKKAKRTSEAI